MEKYQEEESKEETLDTKLSFEEEEQSHSKSTHLEVISRLAEIREIIEKSLQINTFKDEAIARMSKQIEAFEQDILWKIKQPLLKEFITLYDSVDRLCARFQALYDGQINQELDSLKEELESILYRHDIELLSLGETNKMDAHVHKVVKRETTSEESLAETVIVLRQGLTYKNSILRKHEVILKTLNN